MARAMPPLGRETVRCFHAGRFVTNGRIHESGDVSTWYRITPLPATRHAALQALTTHSIFELHASYVSDVLNQMCGPDLPRTVESFKSRWGRMTEKGEASGLPAEQRAEYAEQGRSVLMEVYKLR